MGLRKRLTLSSGIEIKSAYFRIKSFSGNGQFVEVSLEAYVDRNAFLEGKTSLTSGSYKFQHQTEDDSMNVIRQAYAYLKNEEGFEDAYDVLEDGQEPLI